MFWRYAGVVVERTGLSTLLLGCSKPLPLLLSSLITPSPMEHRDNNSNNNNERGRGV